MNTLREISCAVVAPFVILAACGGGDGSTGPVNSAPITIIAGANVADTIQAILPQAVIVEVRTNGALQKGVVVRFTALPSAVPGRLSETAVQVTSVVSSVYGSFVADSTDASGRAHAIVKLGTVAGTSKVLISVPELGVQDTARFTVQAGGFSTVKFVVRDTLVNIGGTYPSGPNAVDRFGNARTDTPTLSTGDLATSISGTGQVSVGTVVGRGFVVAKIGTKADTSRFTVVPIASIVALAQLNSGTVEVQSMSFDGSNRKTIASTSLSSTAYPTASSTGGIVAFHQTSDFSNYSITVADSTGTRRTLTLSTINNALSPHVSADGKWIYFQGRPVSANDFFIFRVHPDGSGLEQLTTGAPNVTTHATPSPSFDGTKFAYVENGVVAVRAVTGTTPVKFSAGALPVLSPDGQSVAFIKSNQRVAVAPAAGGTAVEVSSADVNPSAGLTWTKDGQWLISRNTSGSVIVITPSTTQTLTLPPAFTVYQISALP